jgi:hypothetical protein
MGSKKKRSDIEDIFAIPLIVNQGTVPELELSRKPKSAIEHICPSMELSSNVSSAAAEVLEVKEE